jgi:hypothetical protein
MVTEVQLYILGFIVWFMLKDGRLDLSFFFNEPNGEVIWMPQITCTAFTTGRVDEW